jgi:hypothetical protein
MRWILSEAQKNRAQLIAALRCVPCEVIVGAGIAALPQFWRLST